VRTAKPVRSQRFGYYLRVNRNSGHGPDENRKHRGSAGVGRFAGIPVRTNKATNRLSPASFQSGNYQAGKGLNPIAASDLVALLEKAGIRRARVFSIAYQFSNPNKPPFEDEYERVKAENDWTSRQVALFPDRLRGFCTVNPLKDYAIAEIGRCAKDPQLHAGRTQAAFRKLRCGFG
jgi:Predicted metal-dependent hydrolase of the TIM-barrel fold